MKGEDLTIAATAMANLMATCMSVEQLNEWAVLFSLVGDALGVIAASRTSCQSKKSESEFTVG